MARSAREVWMGGIETPCASEATWKARATVATKKKDGVVTVS